jgi:hypothetical protein
LHASFKWNAFNDCPFSPAVLLNQFRRKRITMAVASLLFRLGANDERRGRDELAFEVLVRPASIAS